MNRAEFIRRNARSRWVLQSAKWARRFLQIVDNERFWKPEQNGEYWLLNRYVESVGQDGREVQSSLVDVGANRGDWSVEAASLLERRNIPAEVVSFEPNPRVFPILSDAAKRYPRIRPINSAVGAVSGTLDISVPEDDTMGSFSLRPGVAEKEKIAVAVFGPEDFDQAIGDRPIGFLKIDTEGAEMDVLAALAHRIRRDRPLIQFEYGKTWVPFRAFLKDAYDVLEPLGYRIGRIFPNWIDFSTYDLDRMENYRYGNYCAAPPLLYEKLNDEALDSNPEYRS